MAADETSKPESEKPEAREGAEAVAQAAQMIADAMAKEPDPAELRKAHERALWRYERALRALATDARARVSVWELGEPADNINGERLRARFLETAADLTRIERQRLVAGLPPF